MAALYDWLTRRAPAPWREARAQIWHAVSGRPAPRLAPALAARFYAPDRPLFMSVSQLEKFAACPLQYFMHYTLGLRPRLEFALDSMDVGTLHHSILERVYRRIIADEIPWPACGAESLRAPLEAEVDAAIEELHREVREREPGYEKTRARIKRVLAVILEADRRRACASSLRPREVEVSFGRHGGAPSGPAAPRTVPLKMLQVTTPGGHAVHVNGKIDRLDTDEGGGELVSVVDYKTTHHRALELYRVLWGLTLQLPAYAVAQRELAGRRPIAAYYLGLMIKPQRVIHAGDAHLPGSDAFYQQFKPHGMFDVTDMFRLDGKFDEAGTTPWYKARLNKDGTPAKTSELFSHEDFTTVLDFARWKIGALADDLMGGKIAPDPYRRKHESPCTECTFASLCPFDRVTGTYREMPPLKNGEALAAMRAAIGKRKT
jgi:ATP-dependent helicase/nuclease subunit B